MKSIILLPCSKNKINTSTPIKALDLYDGPFYRVIRKAAKEGAFLGRFDIYIISAKYGLISSDELLLPYDKRFTRSEALEMRNSITHILNEIILKEKYNELYSFLGKDYRLAIDWDVLPIKTTRVSESIGIMQRKLKELILSK